MTPLALLIKSLDAAVWELGEAFDGLGNEDLWRRPDPRLLSVGELAAHLAYWEAQSILGDASLSPLCDERARYYDSDNLQPFSLELTAAEVRGELERVHRACKESLESSAPEIDARNPHRQEWNWSDTLMYQTFHFGYHIGQMYSVRHLLGHETPDN